MSTAFPREAFRAALVTVSGWPSTNIVFQGDKEYFVGPKSGAITGQLVCNFTNSVPEGTDDETLVESTYPNAQTVAIGNRLRVLTLRCESFNTNVDAIDVLERIRTKLQKRSVRAQLRTVGLAMVELGSVRAIDYRIDNRDIATALLEIRFRQKVSEDITEGDGTSEFIEQADVAGTIEGT